MVKTLEEAIEIGKAACASANEVILVGSTQLKNNDLVDQFKSDNNDQEWAERLARLFFTAHRLALGEEEEDDLEVPEGYTSIRDMIAQKMDEYLAAVPTMDARLAFYESKIIVTEKYSGGNCEEMAIYAMKQIVDRWPDISAELYRVFNGDHVVLVLNKSTSLPSDLTDLAAFCIPEKWGPAAVICDPWSNLVYPVSEYKTYLKAYDRINGKNEAIDWIKGHHFLMPHWSRLTSDDIRHQQKKLLKHKLLDLRDALEFFNDKLNKERERLIDVKEFKKSAVLNQKISETEFSIYEINHAIKQAKTHDFNADIRQMLKNTFHNIVQRTQFSSSDKNTLFRPTGKIEKAFSFFGVDGTKGMRSKTITKNALTEIADEFKQRQIRCVK
jgi:hypothetical protein